MEYLVVERSVKLQIRIPIDENNYPGMNRIQATDYELQLPRIEKLEQFVQALDNQEPYEIELTERITVEVEK